MESGALSLEPWLGMAIWLIRGGVEKRDLDAAKQFFMQAMAVVGHAPEYVKTDGHRSYPRAIRETMGNEVKHRTNVSLNNRIEPDHPWIKQRSYPMQGFGNFASAASYCRAFDEIRQVFRVWSSREQKVSLDQNVRCSVSNGTL